MKRSFATCIGACLLLLLSGVASAEQKAISFTADVSKTVELDYLLNVPDGYEADDTRRWPLVLFLHGAGERGDDVWKVALHGPPKPARTSPPSLSRRSARPGSGGTITSRR